MTDSDLLPAIREALESSERSIVVLDDDPAGAQSVFDVPVLTDLSPDAIRDAIDQAPPLLFLLTNSRSLTPAERSILYQEIGKTLKEYADEIILISNSGSPLREHFSLDLTPLKKALNTPTAPTLLIPLNHSTIEQLPPPADADADATTLTPADLHSTDLAAKLSALPPSSTCLVTATSLHDLAPLSLALHKSSRRFIIRSAAPFVQSLSAIISRPPLDPWQMQDLEPNPNGGLIIIGSQLPQATAQLQHLIKNAPHLTAIKLSIPDILNGTFDAQRSAAQIQATLISGQNIVLFTSKHHEERSNSQKITQALGNIIKAITARPSFIIAKGGLTASHLATHALGVKQAQVLGHILPGVPVWTIGNETLHPGLAYIIFPGNIGEDSALTTAYQKLTS